MRLASRLASSAMKPAKNEICSGLGLGSGFGLGWLGVGAPKAMSCTSTCVLPPNK